MVVKQCQGKEELHEYGVKKEKREVSITQFQRMEFELDGSLKEWVKDKPLSILQLDPADRAVLRIAGRCQSLFLFLFS